MRGPYVDNLIIQNSASGLRLGKNDHLILEKDCLDLGNCRSGQKSEKRMHCYFCYLYNYPLILLFKDQVRVF